MKRNLLTLGLLVVAASANAQQIATRANLNSLLTSSTSDDFESFAVGFGAALSTDVSSMDSTTIVSGQGPGLVNPGATYLNPGGANLQWNGDQYFGINTKSILANGSDGAFEIDYGGMVQAMGIDAENFSGFGYNGVMDVYNGATLVGSLNFGLSGNGGDSVFLGWQNAGGITRVVISSTAFSWSPIIDDHTYGTISTVPEPTSLLAVGLGVVLVARRRRK